MLTKLYVRTRNWAECDEGATAVEYGIMVALIAAVIVGTVLVLGQRLDGVFQTVRDALPGVGG